MGFKQALINMPNDLKGAWNKHGPGVMVFIGTGGMLVSIISAVKATPKAMKLIEERKEAEGRELTEIEIIQSAWKPYIPTALIALTSMGCIFAGSKELTRRSAVMTASYLMADSSLRRYEDKVEEIVGKKKAISIKDEIAKDEIERHPVQNNEVIITAKGDTLCYDVYSGRYFKSDIDALRRIALSLRERLSTELFISLNDYYYEVGLEGVKYGDEIGWNFGDELEFAFSSQLATDGTPCLVVDYKVGPWYPIN